MTERPDGWFVDPSDPTLYRHWDGQRWTEETLPRNVPVVPPLPEKEGWFPDPKASHELRYFDGTQWTPHVASGGVPAVDAQTKATALPPDFDESDLWERMPLGLSFRPGTTKVSEVAENSAAAIAGLEPGDLVTAIGSLKVRTETEVNAAWLAQVDDQLDATEIGLMRPRQGPLRASVRRPLVRQHTPSPEATAALATFTGESAIRQSRQFASRSADTAVARDSTTSKPRSTTSSTRQTNPRSPQGGIAGRGANRWVLVGGLIAVLAIVAVLGARSLANPRNGGGTGNSGGGISGTVPGGGGGGAGTGASSATFLAEMHRIAQYPGGQILGFANASDSQLLETGGAWCSRLASGESTQQIAQTGEINPAISNALEAGVESARRNLC